MNLTREQKLVGIEQQGASPKPGHDLVVFEELKEGGRRYVDVVVDGSTFTARKNLFGRAVYVSYPVSTNPALRHRFSTRVTHMNSAHAFDLTFSLSYCVAGAKTLVERLGDDPLKAVCDEVSEVMGGAVAQVPWERIEDSKLNDNFSDLWATVYQNQSERIRDFATTYGIELHNIAAALSLTTEDSEALVAEADRDRMLRKKKVEDDLAAAERKFETSQQLEEIQADRQVSDEQHHRNLAGQQHENDLKLLKAQGRLIDGGVDAVVTSFTNIGGQTFSPEGLERNFESVRRIMGSTMTGDRPLGELSPPTAPPLLSSTGRRQELAKVIAEIMDHFGSLLNETGPRRRCVVAALHWVAELSMGDEADADVLERNRSVLASAAEHLTAEQVALVQRLLNDESLHNSLI